MIYNLLNLNKKTGFIRYLKNISWLFIEKIFRLSLGIFVAVWVARYLGPEQFGIFSYALSFVGLFTAFSSLGLDSIIVKELVKNKINSNILIGTAFGLKVIGSILSLILLGIAILFTSNSHETNMLIFIIASATVLQSFNVIDMYFQSNVLSRYIVLVNITSFFISSIIKILLIIKKASLISFAYVVLLDSTITVLGYIYMYFHKGLNIFEWKFNIKIAYQYLQEGLPLIISNIITIFIMKIDLVMIKELSSVHEVGLYAASLKLTESWYFIAIIICNSLFPALINANEKSKELLKKRFEDLLLLMVMISLSIAITTQFIGRPVIDLLYGKEYTDAANILIVQIWTAIFVFIGYAGTKWLIIEKYQKQQFYRALVSLVVNIILNYPLIKYYGALGAAYATLLSWISGVYIYHLFDLKTRQLFFMQTNALIGIPIFKKLKGFFLHE